MTAPRTAGEVEGLSQALYAKDKIPGEGGWLLWDEHSEKVRDIWRGYALRLLASDWLAEHDARVAAEALQEAADNMPINRPGQPYEFAAHWLRGRADRLATDSPTREGG